MRYKENQVIHDQVHDRESRIVLYLLRDQVSGAKHKLETRQRRIGVNALATELAGWIDELGYLIDQLDGSIDGWSE